MSRVKNPKHKVRIGIVGKYVELPDAYKSLNEALTHGGVANETKVELVYIDAEEIEAGSWPRALFEVDGLLVPIGFGKRGTEGKIKAIRYAREHKVPFFGICLGMQCMTIEFARNVCGIKDATSTEFDNDAAQPVIYKLRDLLGVEEMGGTMRLGAYPCNLEEGSLARSIYGVEAISERHRHRYEVNQKYLATLREHGLVISGRSPDGKFVEMVELPGTPLVPGLPVPSRVQVEADRAASALRLLHRRGARREPEARRRGAAREDRSAREPAGVTISPLELAPGIAIGGPGLASRSSPARASSRAPRRRFMRRRSSPALPSASACR